MFINVSSFKDVLIKATVESTRSPLLLGSQCSTASSSEDTALDVPTSHLLPGESLVVNVIRERGLLGNEYLGV